GLRVRLAFAICVEIKLLCPYTQIPSRHYVYYQPLEIIDEIECTKHNKNLHIIFILLTLWVLIKMTFSFTYHFHLHHRHCGDMAFVCVSTGSIFPQLSIY